jgi:3-oxoacyl-[acyl-carrier protein] reductase
LALIDVLVNNAGIAHETGFLNIEEDGWRRIIDVNLTGAFFVAQAVARKMVSRRRGAIVHMASKNGLDGESGYAHYNASKAGLVLLTKTMALELASFGVRVNAVCPGYVNTPLATELDSADVTRAFAERYIPQERVANPEEIAPCSYFLRATTPRSSRVHTSSRVAANYLAKNPIVQRWLGLGTPPPKPTTCRI